jgi:hypothetical protein
MEFKGTKGEWIANYSNELETYISCNGLRISEAKHYKNHILNDPSTEEGRANAKLIAAAPDLLKVCIDLKEILYDISMPEKVMNDLEVAINKALN